MSDTKLITITEAHAEGEVGNVITSGVAPPPGATLWEQSRFLEADGQLRNLVLNEPRGGVFKHVNLLVPPKHPDAAAGFIIMEPEYNPPMSGSNSICVATVLLETGILPMEEPESTFLLEAPGGLVEVRADCKDGKATGITLTNIPSFADKLDAVLELPGYGAITVDTAFGGDSFVLAKAGDLGLEIIPDQAGDIARLGAEITRAANEQLGFSHPKLPDWQHISFCQFTEPTFENERLLIGKSTVVIEPGKLDRSPCGTGCSARMSVMAARGQLQVGDGYRGLSILDTRFDCRIEQATEIGGRPAIIPTIRGQAWITGKHQLSVDPTDPFPTGYRLSDTWGM